MTRLTIIGLAILLLFPAVDLEAQETATPGDTIPLYILEGLTVTTTRQSADRLSTPQQLEVVSSTEIERSGVNEVVDLLKSQLPIDVIQFPGLLAGVALRGFRPQYTGVNPRTLLLVNGRPAGTANLATLDLATVERIEVLKGPASALYGSSAMGGVVNIITRQSVGSISSEATLGYGSFDTYEARFRSGGGITDKLDFDLALSLFERADDYRVGSGTMLADGTIEKVFPDGQRETVEEFPGDTVRPFSEYGTRSGSVRVGYDVGGGWRADVRGAAFVADQVQSPGDVNAPYDSRNLKDLERYSGELALEGEAAGHRISFKGYGTREISDYYNAPVVPNFINFRTPMLSYGLQLQDAVSIGAHSLIAGVDHASAFTTSESFSDEATPGAPYSPDSGIHSTAAFAETRFSFLDERITATLGDRLDRITFDVEEAVLFDGSVVEANSESYTVFNPSFGLQYLGDAGVRIHASGGRAFVTPDAFTVAGYSELRAGPGSVAITRGNPSLDPENSFTWDFGAGLVRPGEGLEVDLTYFQTDVRDRITSRTSLPEGVRLSAAGDTIRSITTYTNADRAKLRGIEGRLSYDVGAAAGFDYSLRLFANASRILQAEEISGDVGIADRIRNVADLTLTYGIAFDDLDRFGAGLTGRYVGERLDTDFTDFSRPAEVLYPPFMVLDLTTSLNLLDRYELGLGISNLTDENYYEIRGYNMPGRAFSAEVTVKM